MSVINVVKVRTALTIAQILEKKTYVRMARRRPVTLPYLIVRFFIQAICVKIIKIMDIFLKFEIFF